MRNSKAFRLIAMSFMLCTASAAFASSASGWTTSSGGLSLAATAPTTKFTINTASPVAAQCTGTSSSGSLINMTGSPGSPKQLSSSLAFVFSGCTAAGLPANVNCSSAAPQLWGNSYSGGVTSGEVRNFGCTMTVPAFPGCSFTFSASGSSGRAFTIKWENLTFSLLIDLAGQTLTATWSNCPFMNPTSGSASLTFSLVLNLAVRFTSTGAPKPVITNP